MTTEYATTGHATTGHATAPGRFLLLHGWQHHRPAGHWQRWLADRLTAAGHTVRYPQLPDPDEPDLERWLAELRVHVGELSGGEGRRTVICHSLGCLLWLHTVARDTVPVPVDRVLLVAPPAPEFVEQHPQIAQFGPPPTSAARLRAAASYTRIVGSDDDPCCPRGAATTYGGPLGLPTDVLPGAGHLDPAAGYGPWPDLLAWAREPGAQALGAGARALRSRHEIQQ
ncbi:RBBP9/YdeN family alpha/beta hydrolase [Actinomycetota bacterium Odt1-20B]